MPWPGFQFFRAMYIRCINFLVSTDMIPVLNIKESGIRVDYSKLPLDLVLYIYPIYRLMTHMPNKMVRPSCKQRASSEFEALAGETWYSVTCRQRSLSFDVYRTLWPVWQGC